MDWETQGTQNLTGLARTGSTTLSAPSAPFHHTCHWQLASTHLRYP